MTILYNVHTDGDQYRITKFNDGEVEASYLCSETECQCPAGHRPTCRHRMMLPMFLHRGAVDSWWFLDWDRKGWVSNEPEGYRGFDSKVTYEEYYSDPANYKDEISSMEAYAKEVDSERSELDSSSPEPAPVEIATMITIPDGVDIAEEFGKLLYPSAKSTKPPWRRI